MNPISPAAALARLRQAEITFEETMDMSDAQLLRLPTIGRRTLAFLRSKKTEVILARLREQGIRPTMSSSELMLLTRG